jgi:hypothetical protein
MRELLTDSIVPVASRKTRAGLTRFLFKLAIALVASNFLPPAQTSAQPVLAGPAPLLDANHPVQWLFVYKFNASTFDTHDQPTQCIFGGTPAGKPAGQAYAVSSSSSPKLVGGNGIIGTSLSDPVGATFNEIYNSNLNFIVWNDQFYGDPHLKCGKCEKRWGHSKGILAWDDTGNGLILQVTTPDWPGAGSAAVPRPREGNTLGCEHATHNVQYGQDFFALKLTQSDTAAVLDALVNASVVTDPDVPQLARWNRTGMFADKLSKLGQKVSSVDYQDVTLSSGVRLISKASDLRVPPWQLISARLGVPLRTSTWRANSPIPTTTDKTPIACWRSNLGKPRAVEIATTGKWKEGDLVKILKMSASGSHGKLGVSLDDSQRFTIFGDMNQQGDITGKKCDSAQNGRGGLFFVLTEPQLYQSMRDLLEGQTAPLAIPKKEKKPAASTHGQTH